MPCRDIHSVTSMLVTISMQIHRLATRLSLVMGTCARQPYTSRYGQPLTHAGKYSSGNKQIGLAGWECRSTSDLCTSILHTCSSPHYDAPPAMLGAAGTTCQVQRPGADLTVADRNLAMRSCNTGIFRTSFTVGRRLGSVRRVMSTRSFRPLEYVEAIGR